MAVDGATCPIGRSDCSGTCINLASDPMHCGACDNDCTALAGVDPTRARCLSGGCSTSGACISGYGDCNSMASDGCESWLRSPTHCGNCTVSCPVTAPLCSALPTGAIACATSCTGASPDMCGTLCTDVRSDPDNCGTCGHTCTSTAAHTRGSCTASVCGTTCDVGYHLCTGVCVSNSDPATCGTRCSPCPTSSGGTATCTSGACGIACDPMSTMCGTTCVDTLTDALNCGGCMRPCAGACVTGVCDTTTHLTVVTGDAQMGYPDQLLATAIVIRVENAAAMPVVGATVTFTVPPGAVVMPAMATTDTMGRATVTLRLGRALGAYHVDATAPMATAPAGIDASAIAPPVGTLFPIQNVAHTPSAAGTPGPATIAGMGAARGLAIDTDGTVYVSDATYQVVRAISPAGVASIVAGRSGMAGSTGDLGPATMALLNAPSGLALDSVGRLLYVADTNNARVRVVNLATGIISNVAGGGVAAAPTYGDGGAASAATLALPGHVRLGPDGALYVSDVGHNSIRRVDVITGLIGPWMAGGLATCTGATVALYGCQAEGRSCDVVWDATGRAFISGYWCGSGVGTTTYAIVRRATDGTLTRVAGVAGGSATDGNPATAMLLSGAGSLASDPGGNVYYVEPTVHKLRRIDGTQTIVTTIAGTGVAGYGSDYIAAMGQPLSTPWDVAFDASRNLYVSEVGSEVVRTVWQAGAAMPSGANLAAFGAATMTIEVDRQTSAPLAARLTDGASAPLVGLPVAFAAIDDGAAVVATSTTTTAMGVGATFGRPGLLPGAYRYEARFNDLHGVPVMGSPVGFTVTGTAPAAGTIFTAVNVNRVAGGTEGPGTLAQVGQIAGLAAAADGTLYIADRTEHVVWKLSPHGQLARYAGTIAGPAFSGDAGPALMAHLYTPTGLALDEANHTLYVADLTNARIRSIDTVTGIIRTFAGGGLATLVAPYGDGGSATAALLAAPGNVAVDPAGKVYVSDTGHNRIRVVDPATGIITAWLGTTTTCATAPVAFYGCNSAPESCNVLFDSTGTAWVSGYLCGNAAPLVATPAYGIVRVSTTGVLTHVAGMRLGATTDGIDAHMAGITGGGWLARNAMGAIYYADFGLQKIRLIDGTTSVVTTVTGTGVAGFMGDYAPAISGQVSTPWGLVLSGGHLFFSDSANDALRVIY